MTRLAVLADVHGNLPALQAVIADMEQFKVDQVVVAGDSINWGPFSREALEIITAFKWALIRGNNEYYALDHGACRAPAHWSAFTLPPILRKQLGDHWLNIVACLPDTLSLRFPDAPPIKVIHGIPGNPWVAIFPNRLQTRSETGLKTSKRTLSSVPTVISRWKRQVGRWQIFNPGFVGVPLDGAFSASYMILQGDQRGWQLEAHRRIPFDYDALYKKFEHDNFLGRAGVTAALVVEEFRSAQLRLHPYIVWKRQNHAATPNSFELLAEFLALEDISGYVPPAYRSLDGSLHHD